jgi:hypothetical protein
VNTVWRFLLISFLLWLVPFVCSFPFFTRQGTLTINFWLFKGLMTLVLVVCAFVLFRWFYGSTPLPDGNWPLYALVGLGAVLINIGLDTQTVMRFTAISWGQYAAQVGSIYLLVIVGMSIYQGLQGK